MKKDQSKIYASWQDELKLLYELDQKERKDYANFLMKKGYIAGTYIPNWKELAEEYQKLKIKDTPSLGDRIFGDSFRDYRIKKIINEHMNDVLADFDMRFKMYCLVKHSDHDKDLQNMFLEKLKNINNCDEIVKNLEERIKIVEYKGLKTKAL